MYSENIEYLAALNRIIQRRGGLSQKQRDDLYYFGASALDLTEEEEDELARAFERDEMRETEKRDRYDAMFNAGVFD